MPPASQTASPYREGDRVLEVVNRVDADLLELAFAVRVHRTGGAGVAGCEGAAFDLVVLVDQRGGERLVERPLHAGVVIGFLEVRFQILAGLGRVVAGENRPFRIEVDLAPAGEAVGLVCGDGRGGVPIVGLEILAADLEEAGAVAEQGIGAGGGMKSWSGVGVVAALAAIAADGEDQPLQWGDG